MGTMQSSMLCSTCGQNEMACPGHMGYISLQVPVVNIEFMSVLLKVLSCVCYHCSQLLIPRTHPKFRSLCAMENPHTRLTAMASLSARVGVCENVVPQDVCGATSALRCGGQQPSYERDDVVIRCPANDAVGGGFTLHKLWCILRFIPDDVVHLLGMDPVHSHPVNMLWVNLVVPPPSVRPPVRIKHMRTDADDDLTVRLKNIVRANNTLVAERIGWRDVKLVRGGGGEGSEELTVKYMDLCRLIASYQDGKSRSDQVEYAGERKSVRYRFAPERAKKGRMRGTIFGKRQNYAMRSVITPDPFLLVDEVGLPQWMCQTTTFPERVTRFNFERLSAAVRLGPQVYPGANFILRKGGGEFAIREGASMPPLEVGDVVRRHLINGDLVLLNRQPSLHKLSIMCHRVRVVSGYSIRIHLSVTGAYNADFDGDEMNVLVLQGDMARAEASELLAVNKNLLKDGSIVIKFVQHSVLGAAILCREKVWFSKGQFFEILANGGSFHVCPEPCGLRAGKPYWSGRAVFECYLPKGLFFSGGGVEIVDGKLARCHAMTKSILNNILLEIASSLGYATAVDFLNDFGRVCTFVCARYAVSISADDCMVPCEAPMIRRVLEHRASYGPEVPPESEEKLCAVFDTVRDVVMTGLSERRHLDRNGLYTIVQSGAKGNLTNIAQISAMVGQQRNHVGQRLQTTRIHSVPQAVAEGFIPESFTGGLSSLSYFAHLSSSRVGLIDTAVKTSETGYSQRRLTKAMEDVCINQAESAVLGDSVIQFVYGDDACCGDQLVSVTLDFHALAPADIVRGQHCFPPEWGASVEWGASWLREVLNLLTLQDELKAVCLNRKMHESISFQSPIPYKSLLQKTTYFAGTDVQQQARLSPQVIQSVVFKTWHKLVHLKCIQPTLYNRAAFFWFFSTRALVDSNVTSRALTFLMRETMASAQRRVVTPGENVGTLASQNCTEPLTQLTLNTFHKSGQFSHLVDGVPRMREIMNCAKKPATPYMLIPLLPDVDVEGFGVTINSVRLADIVNKVDTAQAHITLHLDKRKACRHYISPAFLCQRLAASDFHVLESSHLEDPDWFVSVRADNSSPYALWKNELCHIRLRGIPRLLDYLVQESTSHSTVVMTRGSNLAAVLTLGTVDGDRVHTNDIHEIYMTLGIDATYTAIVEEWAGVMQTNDVSVGIRHIMLIADVMCHHGYPSPITYAGVCNHARIPIIKKSAFEKTMTSFVNGAVCAQADKVSNLASAVCFNTIHPSGTGNVHVFDEVCAAPTYHSTLQPKTTLLSNEVIDDGHSHTRATRKRKRPEESITTECLFPPTLFFSPSGAGVLPYNLTTCQ